MPAHAVGSMVGADVVTTAGPRWTSLARAVLSAAGLVLSYLAVPRHVSATQPPRHPAASTTVRKIHEPGR
jgi:hypothetical protein